MNLDDFLQSTLRNSHIADANYVAYVRKSQRLIEGQTLKMFDLSSVTVPIKCQGQGRFKALLTKLKLLKSFDGIFVECIQNEHLLRYLEREGFKIAPGSDLVSPNYYWLFPKEVTLDMPYGKVPIIS